MQSTFSYWKNRFAKVAKPCFLLEKPFCQGGKAYSQLGKPFCQGGKAHSQLGKPLCQGGKAHSLLGKPFCQGGKAHSQLGKPFCQGGKACSLPYFEFSFFVESIPHAAKISIPLERRMVVVIPFLFNSSRNHSNVF